jgi:hypothetical protein
LGIEFLSGDIIALLPNGFFPNGIPGLAGDEPKPGLVGRADADLIGIPLGILGTLGTDKGIIV